MQRVAGWRIARLGAAYADVMLRECRRLEAVPLPERAFVAMLEGVRRDILRLSEQTEALLERAFSREMRPMTLVHCARRSAYTARCMEFWVHLFHCMLGYYGLTQFKCAVDALNQMVRTLEMLRRIVLAAPLLVVATVAGAPRPE